MSVTPKYNDRQTVKSAVYGDVKKAVEVAVGEPSEHIAVDGDSVDAEDPRVFLNASMSDVSRGLHDRRLLEIRRDGDAITDIIYAKRTQLSFDCSIASKTVGTADRVANAIQTVFDAYDNRQLDENDLTASDPPSDRSDEDRLAELGSPPIHDVSVADSSPQNDNQRFGEVLTVMIEYTERQAHSAISEPPSAVGSITVDFEVGATDFGENTRTAPSDGIAQNDSFTVKRGQTVRTEGPYTVDGDLIVDGLFVTTEGISVSDSGSLRGDGRILVVEELTEESLTVSDTRQFPPDSIPERELYTVPDGQSVRIRGPYTVEGTLVVDGMFVTTEPLTVTDSGTVTGDGRILVTEQLSFGEGFRDAIVRPKEVQ